MWFHLYKNMSFDQANKLFKCVPQAMSVSETWYAVTDHGTNYCNLYNLMEGKIGQTAEWIWLKHH